MAELSVNSQIQRIIGSINLLPDQVNKATALALNRTAEWLRGRVTRGVSKETRIKLKLIRERITMTKAYKGSLKSLLNCDFQGVLARDLGPMRQTPPGAKAGGRLFEKAFIANLGHEPGMYRRLTKKRFPLKSVRIPIYDDAVRVVDGIVGGEAAAVFEKRFAHEIGRITRMVL
jgi:hypothetical protein